MNMLTIEYEPDGVLEINVDAQGIQDLVNILGQLEPGDHEHLFDRVLGRLPAHGGSFQTATWFRSIK